MVDGWDVPRKLPIRHSRAIGVRGRLVLCVLAEQLEELLALDVGGVADWDGPPLRHDLLSGVRTFDACETRAL